MSLLTIAETVALNCGMQQVPTSVSGSSERRWQEVKDFSEKAAMELVRRVDWGELTREETLTGDGTNKTFDLPPDDYDHLTNGVSVVSGGAVLRGLSQAEWRTLTPVEGDPRYFILQGSKITLWPYLATSETATVSYQSKNWCSAGGSEWAADEDTSLIDEDVLAMATIVRWRRQKGMSYDDFEAEYEAMLSDRATFDDRGR
ncbi:hypothetical protein [Celeribacter sp. SCSIO 80788]|uniref:phage adaptor protein n=1 Tax=Celeribacter sp. SCSIO 80788 TaxID=3117013 RepID=UPI003DA4675C